MVSSNLNDNSNNHKRPSFILFICLFILLQMIPYSCIVYFNTFLSAFATESQEIMYDYKLASDLLLVLRINILLGKILCIIFTWSISQFIQIIIGLSIASLSSVILLLLGHKVSWILWIFSSTFGISFGSLQSLCLTWINDVVPMTPTLTSLAFLSNGIGYMILFWLGGFLFELWGPRSVMVITTSCLSLEIVTVLSIYALNLKSPLNKGYN